ncbi:hypothetical protein [Cellulomonas citrea]|uniref:hypothetical protein n=1 Tax=Cellulomonas citrea TaxID=1909423 RepID=UPI001358AB9A|nr:hypothetical protein [Cellulomonas citrea]
MTLDEARARYATLDRSFVVVDASQVIDEQTVQARWTVGFAPNGWVRARFFSPVGSVTHLTDYAPIDGRLWRSRTIDYTYPDDEHEYVEFQALRHVTCAFEPDGSATVIIVDKEHSTKDVGTSEHVHSEGFWMDRPAFGDWDDLTDKSYGIPPTEPGWQSRPPSPVSSI